MKDMIEEIVVETEYDGNYIVKDDHFVWMIETIEKLQEEIERLEKHIHLLER